MGFFYTNEKLDQPELRGLSVDFLHRQQCNVCPLNNQSGLRYPHMAPTGSDEPVIYVLGDSPTVEDDKRGVQFSSKSGRYLRQRIPDDRISSVRFNNVVRTRTPDGRDPSKVEMECCRPSVVADIEQTKPRAIFGIGSTPLLWALGQTGISKWTGRYIPIRVGSHTCWFFPMLDPLSILRTEKKNDVRELEFQFDLDLRRALELSETLPDPVVHSVDEATSGIELITGEYGASDVRRVVDFLASLYEPTVVGLDYETSCLRPYKKGARILTVGLSAASGTLAFPLYHRQRGWTGAQLEEVQDAFTDFLYKAPCRKVVHQLAFEMEWSAYFYGEKVLRAGKWGDTIAQAFILDERHGKSLEMLCLQYFGVNIKQFSDTLDTARLDDAALGDVLGKAVDAKYHRLLYLVQKRRIEAEKLTVVYERHLRRVPTVVLTQLKGVPVDQKVVKQMKERFEKERDAAAVKMEKYEALRVFRRKKGHDFRPSSNPDVLFMLRSVLNLDVTSSDEKVLRQVDHPLAQLVIDWKKAAKMLSTYVESWQEGGDNMWPDGLLHPILSLVNTRTWRTASEEPNSQNTPKRGANRVVRKQVRGSVDQVIAAFDYAGIQARNVAMESRDKNLVEAFWNEYDIHADWLERIRRQCPSWISTKALKDKDTFKDYRGKSKNGLVFPLFFGAQPRKVGMTLGIGEHDAQDLYNEFWGEFPEIKTWHEKIEKFYREHGYVTGLSEFRRRAPISQNQLINSPIQSDESLLVLEAMARLSEYEEPRYQANMEIHDDLTFVWPRKEVERNAEVVVTEMLRVEHDWINVPIVVEMSVGDDWYDMVSWGDFSSDKWNGHVKAPRVVKPAETNTWADGETWDEGDA